MEQLTMVINGKAKCAYESTSECQEINDCWDCKRYRAMVDSLNAYQCTGGTPEECASALELLRKKEHGLVVLKEICEKLGDYVYKIDMGEIDKCLLLDVSYDCHTRLCVSIIDSEKHTDQYSIDDIGKTLFLSLDKAQAALSAPQPPTD